MKILTVGGLKELKGKVIKWQCADALRDKKEYLGVAEILDIDFKKFQPIKARIIEGSDLNEAEFKSTSDMIEPVSLDGPIVFDLYLIAFEIRDPDTE